MATAEALHGAFKGSICAVSKPDRAQIITSAKSIIKRRMFINVSAHYFDINIMLCAHTSKILSF